MDFVYLVAFMYMLVFVFVFVLLLYDHMCALFFHFNLGIFTGIVLSFIPWANLPLSKEWLGTEGQQKPI